MSEIKPPPVNPMLNPEPRLSDLGSEFELDWIKHALREKIFLAFLIIGGGIYLGIHLVIYLLRSL